MRCLNCGEEDFEKSVLDGVFTLPYGNIEVPRYFCACLGCGLVHQYLDLNVRREELKNFVDSVIKKHLLPLSRSERIVDRVKVDDIQFHTKIPEAFLLELIRDVLKLHPGYQGSRGTRIIPELAERENALWILSKMQR